MKWWAGLRMIGLLRRIAKALEAANELKREELGLAYPDWIARTRKRPKVVSIETASIEDWNAEWRKEQGLE